jgi:hypothetical protein
MVGNRLWNLATVLGDAAMATAQFQVHNIAGGSVSVRMVVVNLPA